MMRAVALLALVALAAAQVPNTVDQSINIKQVAQGSGVTNLNTAAQDGRILVAGQGNLIRQQIFANVESRIIPTGTASAAKKGSTRNLLSTTTNPLINPDIKVNPNVALQVQGTNLNARVLPQVGVTLNGRVDQQATGTQYIAPNAPGPTANVITGSQVGVVLQGNVRQRVNTAQRIEG